MRSIGCIDGRGVLVCEEGADRNRIERDDNQEE